MFYMWKGDCQQRFWGTSISFCLGGKHWWWEIMQIYDSHNHVSMTSVFRIGVIGECMAGFSKLKGPKKTSFLSYLSCLVLHGMFWFEGSLVGRNTSSTPRGEPHGNWLSTLWLITLWFYFKHMCFLGGDLVRHGHFGAYCFGGFDPPRSGPAKIQWGCKVVWVPGKGSGDSKKDGLPT